MQEKFFNLLTMDKTLVNTDLMTDDEIAQLLRLAAFKKGLKNINLADGIGIAESTVHRVLQGKSAITTKSGRAIIDALGFEIIIRPKTIEKDIVEQCHIVDDATG